MFLFERPVALVARLLQAVPAFLLTALPGGELRKLVWVTSACALLAACSLARAQELDIAVSGSTLFSARNTSASQAFLPPAEEGGTLAGANVQIIHENHFGYSAEGAFRYHEGLYNGFQRFRPVFYDVNGVYSRHLANRMEGDFMAGVGGQTLIFYNQFATCRAQACSVSVNSTHFLFHLGGGIRYRLLGSLFVRPEAHYYRIINNSQFNSGNVLRLGASVGFTVR
jgi:hypothetical protein